MLPLAAVNGIRKASKIQKKVMLQKKEILLYDAGNRNLHAGVFPDPGGGSRILPFSPGKPER